MSQLVDHQGLTTKSPGADRPKPLITKDLGLFFTISPIGLRVALGEGTDFHLDFWNTP